MTDPIELQRRRDGAFFEDWSDWRDLGSPPRFRQGGDGFRPRAGNHAPSYHCVLRKHLPFDGRAGFEVAVPSSTEIARLIRIAGGWEPRLPVNPIMVDTWYVPAENWPALRKVLPQIKTIVATRASTLP